MKIKIKPLDLLFFRDGKPFDMGEDTAAKSMMLPYLTTIYGAIRSCYFAKHPNELEYADTENDKTRNLVINNMYYLCDGKPYFPMPRDLLVNKEESKSNNAAQYINAERLKCKRLDGNTNSIMSKYPISYYYQTDKQMEELKGGIISYEELMKYSKNEEKIIVKKINEYINYENKVGIARDDKTKGSKEQMLYQIGQVRYKNLELVVEFEGLDIGKKGYMRLGGQGNAATYTSVTEGLVGKKYKKEVEYIKLYLATPAIFAEGWIPDFINKGTLKGKFAGKEVTLMSACIGNSLYIGGYNMKKRENKPMYKAVPAGSIYLLRVEGKYNLKSYIEEHKLESINSNEGYGKVFVMEGHIEE